ncbi:MAG: glycosyltransferase family 4 protein [Chthoniobacterales bacterium]|nr:glycosyltransferase family 4 protein [Chthoniobacterales bacterium]
MKILFDHPSPFMLAHGGFATQIEQTKRALEALGVSVEYLRWWDAGMKADLIHHFAPASTDYLSRAQAQKIPVAMTTLFTETCNRSSKQLAWQKWITRTILAFPAGESVKERLGWRSFHLCAQNVVGLQAERRVLEDVYGVAPEKISVIPLGLSEAYLNAPAAKRDTSDHLICTGTITQRKHFLELAEMARATQTPILFVGMPYHASDPYWLRFQELIDGNAVRYHPHVTQESEMIGLLQRARGFVLMSEYENWCLSCHEAAACGLPLLVPDQPWSRERFGDKVHYFPGKDAANREVIRSFYDNAPNMPVFQIRQYSWTDTATELKKLYKSLLR